MIPSNRLPEKYSRPTHLFYGRKVASQLKRSVARIRLQGFYSVMWEASLKSSNPSPHFTDPEAKSPPVASRQEACHRSVPS